MLQSNTRAARRPIHALAIAAGALLSFGAMSALDTRQAHADWLIGADVNGGFNVGELSADGLGLGANLRVGYELPVPLLRLAPELQLNYMGFSIEDLEGQGAVGSAASANLRAFSGRAGARVGFGAGVGGSLYAHVGYGTAGTGGEVDFRQNGLSYDAGLSLDVTFIPFINFGLHGGFNSLLPSGEPDADPINWIDVGLHVELVF